MTSEPTVPTPTEIDDYIASVWPSAVGAHTCVESGTSFAVVRAVFDERSLRPGGVISGPTQFAVADRALWCASFTVIGLEAMAVTSELSIRFLSGASGGDLFARADIDKVGRTLVVGSVRCWVDGAEDRPVSVAQGTYVRPRD